MSEAPFPSNTPLCPRCGYDQSGAAAEWDDACPLGGKCPECGHDFQWADVFRPERNDRPGFFEHRAGVGPLSITAAKLAWPLAFWSWITLDHRVRLGRAAWLLTLLLLPAHLAASALGIARTHLLYAQPNAPTQWAPELLDYLSYFSFPVAGLSAAWRGPRFWIWHNDGWPWYVPAALTISVAFPLVLVLLPFTREAAKVRWQHLARAAMYGTVWLVPLVLFRLGRNLVGSYLAFEQMLVAERVQSTGQIWTWTAPAPPMRLSEVAPAWTGALLLGWIGLWWWVVIVRAWKLRDAWLIYLTLALIALLAALVQSRLEEVLFMLSR